MKKNLNQLDGCGNVFWNRENEKELISIKSVGTKRKELTQACV